MTSFVSHLECSYTGTTYPKGHLYNLSDAGYPLLVRYDLDGIKAALTKASLGEREQTLWRYRELLPMTREDSIVSLGEIVTPMLEIPRASSSNAPVWVKDEGRLPTGSFKARGLALAITMANELGVSSVAMPTNGNAGAALSAYATRAGMTSHVFCPADTPEINISETALQGAEVYRVDGLINDCGKIVGAGVPEQGWFDVSTLKEPYRIEGKKTMGLELCEQLGWSLPDVIFYPTGGGTGLIGMWKAFHELESLGWFAGKKPRMVAVQATGCAPIVRAYEQGTEHAALWSDAHTVAAGIRVPAAIGDFLILRAVRDSGGFAIAVTDSAIEDARAKVASQEGLLLCPEGAATFAAYESALHQGLVSADESAVLFNCATGLKYPMPSAGKPYLS